jgi:hypothetical protein
MNAFFHHSKQTEDTAWILIAVLLGLILVFCYLFQQRISRDLPQGIYPPKSAGYPQ